MRSYRPCLTAVLVALGTAAASPAFAARDPEDVLLLAESRTLLEKGDFRTALIQLKKAVKANPNNPDARFELGRLEFQTGDLVGAEKDLTQARENGYPVATVNPLLATTLLADGKFQQLLNSITPCPDDQACKADVLALRARAYLFLRDLDNADKESLEALKADPNGITSQATRAQILMRRNDTTGAEQIVDKILTSNPKAVEALIIKGDLRRRANDPDAAIKNFRAALEISPKDIRIRQSLAMALIAKGQDDEARGQIDQVLQQAPNSVMALYARAILLLRAHKNAEALDTVRPVEAAITQIPQGTFLLALIHFGSNNVEEALDYASRFHAEEPDNVTGTKLLANINFRLRAYSKVISILAPIRDRLSDDAEALDLLGSAYLAEGQITEANEALNAAVIAQPNNPLTSARLAISQTRQDSTREEGLRQLESLVKSNPKNLQIDLALVSSYIGAGDYDRAIAAATTMIDNQPDSAVPLSIRGAAKMAKGDAQAARADFESALAKNADYIPAAVYLTELDMQAGNFEHARALLDPILKRNPTDLRAFLARAQIEQRANKPAAAEPFLEAAIKDHPDEIAPRAQLIQVEIAQGHQDKAASTASDLARSQPKNPSAIDIAARTLLAVGHVEDGLALYRDLQTALPDNAQIRERYGLALSAAGKTEEAKAALDRAISVDQRYMSAWSNRVSLELKSNGLESALAIAEKAKLKNPDNPVAAILPGDLLRSAGKAAEAEAAFRKAFEQKPSTITAGRVFGAIVQKGNHAEADAFLLQWIQKNPADNESRLILADHFLARGNYHDAAAQLETVLKVLPRNVSVLNNLAWAYGRMNDPRAVEIAERAYTIAPNASAIMDTYGYLLYQGGDRQRAPDLIRRSYEANPKDPQVAYHMAKILVDSKNAAEARNILKGIVESKEAFDGDEEARKLYGELGGS